MYGSQSYTERMGTSDGCASTNSSYLVTYNGDTASSRWEQQGACVDDCVPCRDNCFGLNCGCDCDKIYSGSSIGTPPYYMHRTKDATSPSCGFLKDNDHYASGTVTFIDLLETYNHLGELVSNPIPSTPYDPCNPIRIATAPGCHFFATPAQED